MYRHWEWGEGGEFLDCPERKYGFFLFNIPSLLLLFTIYFLTFTGALALDVDSKFWVELAGTGSG